MRRSIFVIFIFVLFLSGCASAPSIHDDLTLPPGKIEGNQFTGIRYPFKVSIPSQWKMVTVFPDFLKGLGYDEPGASDKELTELYIFNPSTQSTVQIDFTPASRRVKFSQEKIERFTTAATGSFKQELEEEHGKGIEVAIGPTEPITLKGVPFAAKKYATYALKGAKREQGWIYGYTEPNQLFIFYVLLEKDERRDREDLKKILDSFEVLVSKK